MKTFLVTIILFFSTCINAQSLRLGIAGSFLTGNKYYSYQFGPALLIEYSFNNFPITLIGSMRGYISELSKDYLPGYNNNIFSIGASVNFYPINWAIEPYAGIGVFYNSNDFSTGGMRSSFNGSYILIDNTGNNFSAELTGGVKFSANTPVNFIVEITQSFSKPAYLIKVDETTNRRRSTQEIYIFNSLMVKLGLMFQL